MKCETAAMIWVMFVSGWVGLAVALPGRRGWWVAGPIAVAIALGAVGAIAPLFVAVYLSPIAGIALALIAGWTRERRPNIALGAVVATFIAAYAGLTAQTSDGREALGAFTGVTVLLCAVAAISWILGRSAREMAPRGLHARRRADRGPSALAVSSAAVQRRPVLPPPPRH